MSKEPQEYLLQKRDIPQEIQEFIEKVFEIYRIRGRVGRVDGIVFEIRTNEKNHSIQHVHAKYGEFEISIDINLGEVLCGNLPKKNQKTAEKWVKDNRDKLLKDWNTIAISAISHLTASKLEWK